MAATLTLNSSAFMYVFVNNETLDELQLCIITQVHSQTTPWYECSKQTAGSSSDPLNMKSDSAA